MTSLFKKKDTGTTKKENNRELCGAESAEELEKKSDRLLRMTVHCRKLVVCGRPNRPEGLI